MSGIERTLLFQIRALALPEPEREYRFARPRRWRFDFAWPDLMIAVECEGGVFSRGRHVRGVGFENDCEKYNAATERGWRVYRYTRRMIDEGRAIEQLERVLNIKTLNPGENND